MLKRVNDKRTFGRIKLRTQCEVEYERGRFVGTVLDISPSGIFVRMSPGSSPPMGTEARVYLKDTPAGDMTLLARVSRTRTLRRELMADGGGGIGLEIYSAPEAYYRLLADRM